MISGRPTSVRSSCGHSTSLTSTRTFSRCSECLKCSWSAGECLDTRRGQISIGCSRNSVPTQSGEDKEYDRATVDLEHIAPQRTFSAKKYGPWRDVIGVGEGEFNQYRNRLGNLTLLEERLNEKASDNPFQQKKDQYKLSDFEMTQAVREEYDVWTVDEIEDG
mgnify:CR=1 FL=1